MSDKKKASSLPLPDALASNFQDAANWFSQLWANSAEVASGARTPGAGIPSMLLPTLDVKELEKRIADMRSVESWLELNLGLLRTTIQGLEMQKQTLQTWQSFQNPAARKTSAARAGAGDAAPASGTKAGKEAPAAQATDAAYTAGFQPQAWWDALNQQFGQMAAQANQAAQHMADASKPAAKSSASATRPKST